MKRNLALLFAAFFIASPALALDRLIEVLAVGVTDNAGAVLGSGTVTVYDAGTTNLRTVYSDFALSSPVVNPLTLDSAGRAVVYTDKRVKLLIKNSGGSTVRTIDNVGTADSDISSATAAALAGTGLTAPGDGTLSVNVDNVTTSLNGSLLRVKPGATGAGEFFNGSISPSVAANALTIALRDSTASADPSATSPVNISFRSSTITSGAYVARTITAAASLVISSGSTLGHASATAEPIYVYAIDNAGTVELAASARLFDDGSVVSTTAEGGGGAADSRTVMYSTTARSNVASRLIARLASTQTTAGTWAAAITEVAAPTANIAGSVQVERTGPILRKKSGSSNTAYLQKNDGTQTHPILVTPDTGTSNNGLYLIRGTITSAGATTRGEGFTSARISTGIFDATFSTAFAATPSCLVTADAASWVDGVATYDSASSSASVVRLKTSKPTVGLFDMNLSFVCVGERPSS
jgi:hypothetical protein